MSTYTHIHTHMIIQKDAHTCTERATGVVFVAATGYDAYDEQTYHKCDVSKTFTPIYDVQILYTTRYIQTLSIAHSICLELYILFNNI